MHDAAHTTAHALLIAIPKVFAIWLLLLVLAVAALGALSVPDPRTLLVVQAVRRAARAAQRGDGGVSRVQRRAEEAARCAEEIALAARRAAVTADRRRAEWVAAHRAAEQAWRAFEDADREVRRVVAATAFPPPSSGGTDRERHLDRIVERAYRRGELSREQRDRARRHQDGFDPALHPCEQEVVLRRAVREHRLRQYLAASAKEREAWRTADLAAAARRSLAEEALAAAGYADRLRRRVADPYRHRRPLAIGRPHVAGAS
ncbi:MAG TPA: hypothetical protein VF054_21010 [Micromonosporaceae bacterium]